MPQIRRKRIEADAIAAAQAEANVEETPEAPAVSPCDVSLDEKDDPVFAQAYDTSAFVASCEKCGLKSSVRSSEAKARRELGELCAARLSGKADGED